VARPRPPDGELIRTLGHGASDEAAPVSRPVPLVTVTRSGVEEAVHLGSVAVVDEGGALVASAGDPGRVAFARSSMKPLQAAVSLELLREELTDAEVAVMCASHNGEPMHIEMVRSLLERAGLGFASLRCPPTFPLDAEAARGVSGPAPELHNCSGKHAGMLLASRMRGFDTGSYLEPEHPVQQAVLEAVSKAADGPPVGVGTDGCGLPVHAFSLAGLALIFARLVRPGRLGSLASAAERAVRGMLAEPYLVAGRDRVCTAVMEVVPGVVVKAGAEGLLCAGVVKRGVGIAVKIEDGSSRACPPALLRVLRLLGVLAEEHQTALQRLARPSVLGGGRRVGELRADFELDFS
jgi:L-asparaginase II